MGRATGMKAAVHPVGEQWDIANACDKYRHVFRSDGQPCGFIIYMDHDEKRSNLPCQKNGLVCEICGTGHMTFQGGATHPPGTLFVWNDVPVPDS
jgi:hypothetical protein